MAAFASVEPECVSLCVGEGGEWDEQEGKGKKLKAGIVTVWGRRQLWHLFGRGTRGLYNVRRGEWCLGQVCSWNS